MSKKHFYLLAVIFILMGCRNETPAPTQSPSGNDGSSTTAPLTSAETADPTLTPPPAPTNSSDETSEEGSVSAEGDEPVATVVSVDEPTPAATVAAVVPTAVPINNEQVEEAVEQLEESLDETLKEQTGSDLAFGGFEAIETRPINLANGSQLFTSYTVGFRPFDPVQNHFVMLMRPTDSGFEELGRVELSQPDVMFADSVTTLEENGRLWLEVQSGIGAHGGCFDLLLWNGSSFSNSISHCYSSPVGAGDLTDLDGDGRIDVILNNTNDYVFCYACGVRQPSFEIRTFNDTAWELVPLREISTGGEAIITRNNTAVALANAGLWKAADEMAASLDGTDPVVFWNKTIIEEYVKAHQALLNASPYPLMQFIYFGDYEGALSLLRTYPVAEIFSGENNPLLVGTVAEGYHDALAQEILTATDRALALQPDLAEAHFLRGWAKFLQDPSNPAVLQDIQQAATLSPTDSLYVDSLLFLSGE